MIETTERFLREIADKVGAESVEEIHLFPPIRQGGVETGAAVIAAGSPVGERHVVYSASYRHTLKGPDRGKWEVEVTAEADAPLMTVIDVVHGVMKRAGEPFEPERLSGTELRSIIGDAPAPQASPGSGRSHPPRFPAPAAARRTPTPPPIAAVGGVEPVARHQRLEHGAAEVVRVQVRERTLPLLADPTRGAAGVDDQGLGHRVLVLDG